MKTWHMNNTDMVLVFAKKNFPIMIYIADMAILSLAVLIMLKILNETFLEITRYPLVSFYPIGLHLMCKSVLRLPMK